MEVALASEGYLDLLAMRRLLDEVGLRPGDVFWGEGRNTGKHRLDDRIAGYRAGADHGRAIFVLRDLDDDANCAPDFLTRVGVVSGGNLCFRIAVREMEAWIVADRARLANHLRVREADLPADAERAPSPKRAIVAAAARSRSKAIRSGLSPRPNSGREEGPDYVGVMEDFILSRWSPGDAALACDSLARTLGCLRGLAARLMA